MNAFVDEKTTLIKNFKDNYDISVLGELVSFSEYLTDEELGQILVVWDLVV
jgi:hypothetical protein